MIVADITDHDRSVDRQICQYLNRFFTGQMNNAASRRIHEVAPCPTPVPHTIPLLEVRGLAIHPCGISSESSRSAWE